MLIGLNRDTRLETMLDTHTMTIVPINRADYENNNTKNLNFNFIAQNYRASNWIIISLIYVCERVIQRGFFQNQVTIQDALFTRGLRIFRKTISSKEIAVQSFSKTSWSNLGTFPWDFCLGRGEIWTHENVSKRYFLQVENVPYKLLRKTYVCRSMAFPKCHNHPFWTRLFQEGERDDACIHSRVSLNFSKKITMFLFLSNVQIILPINHLFKIP